MRVSIRILALLCAACVATQRPRETPAPDALAFAVCEWDSYNADLIRRAARNALAAGVDAREVPCGPDAWRVVHWVSTNEHAGECDRAARVIRLDPVRMTGAPTRVHVALHELLHAAGGEHVCRFRGELPDAAHPRERCSPVGYGDAVLNPYYLPESEKTPGTFGAERGFTALEEPTDLDRAEIARH